MQYKLALQGHVLHRVSDCAYDLIGQVGADVFRIQVKGTDNPSKRGTYKFQLGRGAKSKTHYLSTDFDIYALVSLRRKCVFFAPSPVDTITKRIGVQKFNEDTEKKTWLRCVKRVLEERL